MNLEKMNSFVSRICFFGAMVLLAVAVLETVVNLFGDSITRPYYTAGRMMEFAAILLVFVIAIVLRQVREEIKSNGKAV